MSTSTRLLVLGVVRIYQPVHGYDVRRELLSWRAEQWASVSPGSVYNALKTLTREGFLEVVGTDQVGGRPERTKFQLTDEGENEFQDLLRRTWWTVAPPLNPLMPALSFLTALHRDELIAALTHRIGRVKGTLLQLEYTSAAQRDESTPEHVREMLALLGARIGSEVEWAKSLIDKLTRGVYPEVGSMAERTVPARPKPTTVKAARSPARTRVTKAVTRGRPTQKKSR